jgi:hypothetical protein
LPASVDFNGKGFVLGRHATHRVGDCGIDQGQAVIRGGSISP